MAMAQPTGGENRLRPPSVPSAPDLGGMFPGGPAPSNSQTPGTNAATEPSASTPNESSESNANASSNSSAATQPVNPAAGKSGSEVAPAVAPTAPAAAGKSPAAQKALFETGSQQKENQLQADPTELTTWTAPQAVFTLHGFFRTRGENFHRFSLGRIPVPGSDSDPPFDNFIPIDDGFGGETGGCGDSPGGGRCDNNSIQQANMRLRLLPQLNLSDNVRLKMWVDMLDMVMGGNPDSFAVQPTGASTSFLPLESFNMTQLPASNGYNALTDSFLLRRVWAEVRNKDLGELRFGRMGFHWGVGMKFNDGSDFDGDFSTDVDRLMGITKFAGLHWMAAYDFAGQGVIRSMGVNAPPIDAGQSDDVTQWMLATAYRTDPEVQKARLDGGKSVFNGGFMLLHRSQLLASTVATGADAFLRDGNDPIIVRRNTTQWSPDLWAQFLYKSLRIDLEANLIAGSVENAQTDTYQRQDFKLMQLGLAMESEYRLLSDKMGLHFNAGFASGDSDSQGLSWLDDPFTRTSRNNTVSTYSFHPNYRIDLILWRNIMRRVAGAYYFRPSISYDLIRNAMGKLLGGRLDVIYSRASAAEQTWGDSGNLGLEFDASIYFRSEDGPEVWDGFHAMIQYGLLFPMQGLGYASGTFPGNAPDLKNAQALRLLLGIVF